MIYKYYIPWLVNEIHPQTLIFKKENGDVPKRVYDYNIDGDFHITLDHDSFKPLYDLDELEKFSCYLIFIKRIESPKYSSSEKFWSSIDLIGYQSKEFWKDHLMRDINDKSCCIIYSKLWDEEDMRVVKMRHMMGERLDVLG